ncbi:MAG: TIGR01777 family protein [Verrucomicrobia bacterium 61-8]|nr:TIGR01777 family oxidoreductase [Verrucomicrobiota bacterium]OJV02111.1 MAG: TIGR01777 family protein [Verrucomicrobia bacterium 61-8]
MKIVIAGGSGHVGQAIRRNWQRPEDEIVILSRRPRSGGCREVGWDGKSSGAWVEELDGCDVLINLAGRSVNCRYTEENQGAIMDSRVYSTRALGEAIRSCKRPPAVWLQSSTATIYAHTHGAGHTEEHGVIGGNEPGVPAKWRFSIDVATAWERECLAAKTPSTRKVLLRSAIIMSRDHGSAFDILLRLARLGLGGKMGDGRQYMSWVHEGDFVRALRWIIGHPSLEGPVNISSPYPLPNAGFMKILREAAGIRFGLSAAPWQLAIGTWMLRSETELILKSRRVLPERLLKSGFSFLFPKWQDAAEDLCADQASAVQP